MATFQTIAHAHRAPAITINGSRFLADVRRATSPEDALAEVDSIRQQYPDASHHCWAYRLHTGNLARSSDDGEPGGSAGRPILAQIDGHELFDIVVVITRYFGGTKLGVGGLIRAYGGTAGAALDQVERIDVHETRSLDIEFPYALTKAVETVLRDQALTAVHTVFEASVRMRLEVPVDAYAEARAALIEHTAGHIGFPDESE